MAGYFNSKRKLFRYSLIPPRKWRVPATILVAAFIGLGFYVLKLSNAASISGFYYHQIGEDMAGNRVRAFDASAQVSRLFKLNADKGSSFRLTAGMDVLSGTSNNGSDNINRSFSPHYGTNHAHNGYMDLFFVGGRYENLAGLQDIFLRLRYDVNPALFVSLNGHSFSTQASVYQDSQRLSGNLGYETDLSLAYLINEAVSLQSGYSQLFASNTFEQLQVVQNPAGVQNWAYLMMIYRPTMKNRFVGLLF